jgi:hypothetical protein
LTAASLPLSQIALSLLARSRGGFASLGWLQFDTCPARLRKADRNRLLRGLRAMLPFADVVHLFTHEFACLRAGRFSSGLVVLSSLNRFFFRHGRASWLQTCRLRMSELAEMG